jgi:hypothetical protein
MHTTDFDKKTCILWLRQKMGLYLCLEDCGRKSIKNEEGCGSLQVSSNGISDKKERLQKKLLVTLIRG